jgi:hypothetical protein
MRKQLKIGFAACALALACGGVQAARVVLDFDDVDNTGGTTCLPVNQYEEGGFRVSVADIPPGAVPDTGLRAAIATGVILQLQLRN